MNINRIRRVSYRAFDATTLLREPPHTNDELSIEASIDPRKWIERGGTRVSYEKALKALAEKPHPITTWANLRALVEHVKTHGPNEFIDRNYAGPIVLKDLVAYVRSGGS